MMKGRRCLLRGTPVNKQRLNAQDAGGMVSRTQLDRFAARIEALVANTTGRLIVVDPDETPEQALRRQGLSLVGSYLFVHTGVPWLLVTA